MRIALGGYLLVEISVTLEIAAWLSPGRTLLLLILGALAGIAVLRRERGVFLSQLSRPDTLYGVFLQGLPERALRALAGLLLIVPGFFSDAAALILLIPQSRQWLIRRFATRWAQHSADPTIIDGEFRRVDDTLLPEHKHGP
jgi:UPF0716 protein FxsA